MFSSNYHTNNNNGVYPLALYLSPLSSHDENNISTSYNHHHHHNHHYYQPNLHPNDPPMIDPHHQFSPPTMAAAVPESLINYNIKMDAFQEQNLVNSCSEAEVMRRIMKKPMKKDRHSKIHTAQGLRDRRVRLSIGIARQFFDLQDMLGFDKASKTVEWLLKKSKKAIREVVHAKKLNNEDECYGNSCDEEGEEEDEDDDDDDGDDDDEEDKSFISGSSYEYSEEVLMNGAKKQKPELNYISSAKGSRGKARERAKERTRDKTVQSKNLDPMRSTRVEGEEKHSEISVQGQELMTHSFYQQPIQELNKFPGQYLENQESFLMGRKMKPSTPLIPSYSYQNEGVMMKDQSSSSNNITISPQHWDIYDQNPLVDPPFCAFTSMNMSTGLQ